MARQTVNFHTGTFFQSVDEFRDRLSQCEKQENCNFLVDSSKLLKVGGDISDDVLKNINYKSACFKCKYAGKPRANQVTDDERQRINTKSYKQDCESFFTISHKVINGQHRLQILKLNENHAHLRSENLFKSMPKQRRHTIESLAEYLKKVVDVRPSIQLLQQQISTKTDVVKRKDIYNFRAKQTRLQHNVTIDLSDLEKVVAEMQTVQGSAVKILHNDNNELDGLMFQDNRMKTYFAQYPDLIMFDATYSLNDRRMPLIIFLIIDGNGESQITGLFFVKTENLNIMQQLFESFMAENPKHDSIQVVITDKHCTNLDVVANLFPQATHHICVFHVSQIFNREITVSKCNITADERKLCLEIVNKMIYAECQDEFDELYTDLQATECQRKTFLFLFVCFFIIV